MHLTEDQKEMLAGKHGIGFQRAMEMLVKYGNAFDAEHLIKCDSVHIFGTDPIEFLSYMLEGVDSIRTVATVHSAYPAETKWFRTMGIPEKRGLHESEIHSKRTELLINSGFVPMFTCAPYLVGNIIRNKAIFSWPGTSGIIIGNSLFGGRGNRDASPAALCSAITGYTPHMLLHKRENRKAEMVIQIEDIDLEKLTDADFGSLGYYIGGVAGIKNIVINGNFSKGIAFEKYKYMLSPMPVSGAVSLCHIVGITPEAPTLDSVIPKGQSVETIKVSIKEIKEAHNKLYTAKTNQVDVVLLGCPHCTISEIKEIVTTIKGKRVKEGVHLWVSTCQALYQLAKQMGFVDIIEKAGGKVFTDLCIMNIPFNELDFNVKATATNSARAAHYHARGGLSGGRGVEIHYGSTKKCVEASISGTWEG